MNTLRPILSYAIGIVGLVLLIGFNLLFLGNEEFFQGNSLVCVTTMRILVSVGIALVLLLIQLWANLLLSQGNTPGIRLRGSLRHMLVWGIVFLLVIFAMGIQFYFAFA